MEYLSNCRVPFLSTYFWFLNIILNGLFISPILTTFWGKITNRPFPSIVCLKLGLQRCILMDILLRARTSKVAYRLEAPSNFRPPSSSFYRSCSKFQVSGQNLAWNVVNMNTCLSSGSADTFFALLLILSFSGVWSAPNP